MQSTSRAWISVIAAVFASATARAQAPASPSGQAKAITANAVQAVQQAAPTVETHAAPAVEPPPSLPGLEGPQPAATPVEPPNPGTYTYDAAGRRDPFVSLLVRGTTEPRARRKRSEGLESALVGEVALKGIVTSGTTYIAMLHAPDKKTYLVRRGQRLLDGFVKTIAADEIVFVQEVHQPLSPVKHREVRRTLRATEDVK